MIQNKSTYFKDLVVNLIHKQGVFYKTDYKLFNELYNFYKEKIKEIFGVMISDYEYYRKQTKEEKQLMSIIKSKERIDI